MTLTRYNLKPHANLGIWFFNLPPPQYSLPTPKTSCGIQMLLFQSLSVTTNSYAFCHAHLESYRTVICFLFVLVSFQTRAKSYTCHVSGLSFLVSVTLWRHLSFLSVCLAIQILFSCPPAGSLSVQSPQGFVAIIIIFSQHALCPLEGWFDRSSLVICLKADFSSCLQHRASAPPPLQVFNVELVPPELLLVAFPPEERLQDRRCAGLWATELVWYCQ